MPARGLASQGRGLKVQAQGGPALSTRDAAFAVLPIMLLSPFIRSSPPGGELHILEQGAHEELRVKAREATPRLSIRQAGKQLLLNSRARPTGAPSLQARP